MTGAGWFHCEKERRRGRERNGGYDICELCLIGCFGLFDWFFVCVLKN